MTVLVVILAVLAVAALVATLVASSRLAAQRRLTAAAEERATRQAGELTTTTDALLETARQRAAVEQQLEAARARAAEAEAAGEAARREAEEAAAARQAAEERAAAAEQRANEFAAARAAAADGGIDPDVLWTLERARSERTWRQSVAPAPDAASVFDDASDPLLEALHVELDAAREDVGAVVELDAELPPGVTPAGSVLVLRAAQELLAGVVRRGEVTTLQVRADGHDLLVAVRSVDEDGEPVATEPLAIPPSADIEAVQDGVRIRNAIRSDEQGPDSPR
jgi:hypothetical protein